MGGATKDIALEEDIADSRKRLRQGASRWAYEFGDVWERGWEGAACWGLITMTTAAYIPGRGRGKPVWKKTVPPGPALSPVRRAYHRINEQRSYGRGGRGGARLVLQYSRFRNGRGTICRNLHDRCTRGGSISR